MKTIENLKSEINELFKEIDELKRQSEVDKTAIKRKENKIIYLRELIKYLEFNPSEDYLKSELDRLIRIVNSYENQWSETYLKNKEALDKLPYNVFSKKRSEFFKSTGISEYKTQITNIKFLLNL